MLTLMRPVGRKTSRSLTGLGSRPGIDRAIGALAARQYGVVALPQFADLGLSSSAVRMRQAAGRLHRVHRAVYAVGHPVLTRRDEWIAAVFAVGAEAMLSLHAAAALWDLRKPRGGPIDVTLPGSGGRPRRRGIVVHRCRMAAAERVICEHIPVTSVALTLLDLAAVLDPGELQRAYERAARLQLLDLRALERVIERGNGRRGVAALGALLPYDPGPAADAASELELLLLDVVRDHDLPLPRVNVVVEGFVVDAYWPEAGVIVEVDGYEFHGDRSAFERDHAKLGTLLLAGYRVLPLTYRQVVERSEWVAEAIRELLAEPPRLPRRP